MVDYPVAGFWFNVGQWCFNVSVAVYLWFSRRRAATTKKVEGLNNRIDAAERQLILVCSDLEHLPDQQQFHRLNEAITALTRELSETKGRLSGMNRAVDLINEFLINQGAKR